MDPSNPFWESGMRNLISLTITACLVLVSLECAVHAEEAAAIDPATGGWKYSEFGASTNTCKSDEVVSNGEGGFLLSKNADGSLQLQPGDGSDSFKCTLKGAEFECPDRASLSHDLRSTGVDAKLTGKVLAKGQFTDSKHMKGQQIATFTCEGGACAIAAMALGTSFPCKVTIDFEAEQK